MHIADSKQNIITDFLQNEEETFVCLFVCFSGLGSTLLTRPEHLPLSLQSPCNYLISCYNKSSKKGIAIITQMQEHIVTMTMFVHKYGFKTG